MGHFYHDQKEGERVLFRKGKGRHMFVTVESVGGTTSRREANFVVERGGLIIPHYAHYREKISLGMEVDAKIIGRCSGKKVKLVYIKPDYIRCLIDGDNR